MTCHFSLKQLLYWPDVLPDANLSTGSNYRHARVYNAEFYFSCGWRKHFSSRATYVNIKDVAWVSILRDRKKINIIYLLVPRVMV